MLLLPLLGCASGSAQSDRDVIDPPPEPPPAAESAGVGYYIRLNRDDGISTATIEGRRPAVFQALLGAFEQVGLEIGGADQVRGVVQSERMIATRQLAGLRMSDLLTCGATLTGDRADSWRIELELMAQVQPDGADKTRLTTRIQATARTTDGTGRNPIACTTKGVLEQKIAEATAARVRSGRP
jgi:hypothetical protein